ncbi:MAG: hypothetical protein FGM32_10550, partial [Candidatus Kapabacteria bacterium]|nr:hypothetical protein [Candidatus Kapabacteria bacterium]
MVRLFVVLVLTSVIAVADPGGKTGFTSKTSSGCGSCHGGNAGSAVSVSLTGPRTLKPGEKAEFTIVVGHATAKSAGISITVRNAATAPSGSAGTLAVAASGSGMRVKNPGSGQEITQSAPKTMTNKQVSFTFSWTAPSTPGSYY